MGSQLTPDFTLESLRAGELRTDLPELYRLADAVECNDWHENENVYEHTLAVIGQLDLLLDLEWLQCESMRGEWQRYLQSTVERSTRRQVLRLAALVHDFAKFETIAKDEDGKTSCRGHEDLSARYVRQSAGRFGLTRNETLLCARIVRDHAEPDRVHNETLELPRRERAEAIRSLYEKARQYWGELLLLALADTLANQLVRSRPRRYHSQVDFFLRCLAGLTEWDFAL